MPKLWNGFLQRMRRTYDLRRPGGRRFNLPGREPPRLPFRTPSHFWYGVYSVDDADRQSRAAGNNLDSRPQRSCTSSDDSRSLDTVRLDFEGCAAAEEAACLCSE